MPLAAPAPPVVEEAPAAASAPPVVAEAPPVIALAPPVVEDAPAVAVAAPPVIEEVQPAPVEVPVANDLVAFAPTVLPEPAVLPEPLVLPEIAPDEALETGEPAAYVAPLGRPRHSAMRAARFRVRVARLLFESAAIIAAAVAVVLVLRVYVVQTFTIPSSSMMPTLLSGDRVLVDKVPRALLNIHLGDMVAFRKVSADTSAPAGSDLIKRVIGLPGQYISSRGDTVYLDGKVLREPWLPALVGACSEQSLGIKAQRIASNHFFVLGDCRGISSDSRAWGTVPRGNLIGR
jgi:signal peptidase I